MSRQSSSDREYNFTPMTPVDLSDLPPRDWLVEGLISRGDLAMIYGPPGSGKTLLAIDIMVTCSIGGLVAGCFPVPNQLRSVYCTSEGKSGLAARFESAIRHRDANAEDVNITVYMDTPQLFRTGGPYGINNFLKEYRERELSAPDLIIIDTLHDSSLQANENSASDTSTVLQSCRTIAQELNSAVLLLHHTNKSETNERGSSTLRAAMDSMIRTETWHGDHRISCAKMKDGEMWEPTKFRRVPVSESVAIDWSDFATNSRGQENDGRRTSTNDRILSVIWYFPAYILLSIQTHLKRLMTRQY